MANPDGHSPDPLTQALVERPYAFDFFRAVRLLECRRPDLPRVGFSLLPSEDVVRFWQKPSLRFAPSTIDSIRWTLVVELERALESVVKQEPSGAAKAPLRVTVSPNALELLRTEHAAEVERMIQRFTGLAFEMDDHLKPGEFRIFRITPKPRDPDHEDREEVGRGSGGSVPRVAQNFFGLFGTHAPLPPHITEYVLERELHHHDTTISAFFNLFHQRLVSLFYRAWAANQKVLDLDRPKDQRYAVYIGALFGIGMDALQDRDAVPDPAKLFFSGRLACQTRNAEGLEAILREYFHIPAEVQPFVGRWLNLPGDCICRLGHSSESSTLGVNSIVGERFWESQLSFRMRFGPMSLADYERMLPQGDAFERLKYWVLNYCGEHFAWDVQLVLKAEEVPAIRLGQFGRLGWTTWLKTKSFSRDADELILNPPPD